MKTPVYGTHQGQPIDVFKTLLADYQTSLVIGRITVDGKTEASLHTASRRSDATFSAISGLDVVVSEDQSHETVSFEDGLYKQYSLVTIYTAEFAGGDTARLRSALKGLGYTSQDEQSLTEAQYVTAVGGTGDYSAATSFHSIAVRAGIGRLVPAPSLKLNEIPPLAGGNLADSQGYFFQNSWFFANGGTHDGNPDMVEELAPDTDSILKFSCDNAGEFGEYLQSDHQDDHSSVGTGANHFYDRATGIITLHHAKPDEFILVRLAVDIEPDSDNSSADIILRCTANSASGGFSFDIEEQLVSLDQGADVPYAAVASIPVFIGDTLAENGTAATIQPIVRLKNTTGDIKPRSLAFFIWS